MVTDDSLGPVGERRQRNVPATGVLASTILQNTMSSAIERTSQDAPFSSNARLASNCQAISVWLPLHTLRTGYSTLDTVDTVR